MPTFRLPPEERLKSSTAISRVFAQGASLHKFPVTLRYYLLPVAEEPEDAPVLRVAFTVPKRAFKLAVDRNRIKRLLREAFRHKAALIREKVNPETGVPELLWVYTGKEKPSLAEVERSMSHLIHHFIKRLPK